MRRYGFFLLAALALGACTTGTAGVRPRPATRPGADVPAATTSLETPRTVDTGVAAQLTGKVKLLSDGGGSVISNNAGNLVGTDGGNLVSDNGIGLISRARYALTATASAPAPAESLLSDARIDVLDAEGHFLVDKASHPITATSDAQGGYKLAATLPDQDLVLRVKLAKGGQLFALVPRGAGALSLDIDTAASLGARYVLDTFVQRQQGVLDRLPATDASALHDAYEGARGALAGVPSYQPADLLAAAKDLEAKAPSVHAELQKIQAILLAGQARLGSGKPATQVALAAPQAVVVDPTGALYIGEAPTGRVRRVAPDGTIGLFAGSRPGSLVGVSALVRLADGSLLACDPLPGDVKRLGADGTVTAFAGGDPNATLAVDVAAPLAVLNRPTSLAAAPDGTVYIGEVDTSGEHSRVLRVDLAGQLHDAGVPKADRPLFVGLAVAPDGTLYAADARNHLVNRRKPDGHWDTVPGIDLDQGSRLAVGPDGALYASTGKGGRVLRLGPDDHWTPVVGNGTAGTAADGTPAADASLNLPAGLGFGPDGTLYVAEAGSGLVLAVDLGKPGLPVRTVAGTLGASQVGTATALSIGSPFGLTVDGQGRVVVSEATGNTVKRLDGTTLTVIAGSTRGPAVDHQAALAAQFDTPGALAYDGATLYVVDIQNRVLRKVDPQGQVTIVAGCGTNPPGPTAAVMPALTVSLPRPTGLAIGPDHLPYIADNGTHRVWRVRPDGMAECVVGLNVPAAGSFGGDGGPALAGELRLPTGLAFDALGNLFIADTGNGVIRKVTGLAGASPTITTFAGTPFPQLIGLLAAGSAVPDGATAATTSLFGVGPLAFDPHGNLLEAEAGTNDVGVLFPALAGLVGTQIPHTGARIRRFAPDGSSVTSVAGDGTTVMNNPDDDDILASPIGLALDGQGRLVVADSGTNQLKLLPLP